MDADFPPRPPVRPHRTRLRMAIGAVLAAFLLGVVATWYLTRGDGFSLGGLFEIRSAEAPSVAATAAPPARTATPDAEEAAGLDQRLAEMEQRLARLDVEAQAAEGNAGRAEDLLVALASRRAIERGAPLGYLAEQLRLRFGEARPGAVRTLIDAARKPVTLDGLLTRLDAITPQLVKAPREQGALGWLSREVGSLFVVRREEAPSPAPEARIERARELLASGRVEEAVSEVRAMPGAAQAHAWVADATRYAAAQRALETLETAAVLGNGESQKAGQPRRSAGR